MLRDSSKVTSGKNKSTYVLVPKRDNQDLSHKSVSSAAASGNDAQEEESGMVFKLIPNCFSLKGFDVC